jgi:two-component system sensor histidine kinase/response regulator
MKNKKNKVLIVEDELLNIEIYKELLEEKYRLSVAETGKKCAVIMEKDPPDIVLLDVMLPDISGIELCRRFKSDLSLRHIPIIIVTTLDSPEDKIKALEVGANDYLTKPVDRSELFFKVQNHLTILEQYRLIKEQNEEISRYVGMIVHDLKNPLAIIMGYIDMLKNLVGDNTHKQYLAKVSKSSQKMLNSINAILDVQKIYRSSFNIKQEKFELNRRIREISAEWKILAGQKRIGLNLVLDPDISLVNGDSLKFKDILENLVSNAVKYSPPDTAVTIATKKTAGTYARITIRDEGLGLSEEDRIKVFHEYQKLSASPTGSETSTGLGLSIVRRMVDLMGGEVGVESEGKNKGAAFWFTLRLGD